jgi:ribosomal protein L44E
MIIGTVATIALYCPRCGKLQKHDISRFGLKEAVNRDLLCSCGQIQATLTRCKRQYLLNIPCTICQTNHIICLDGRKLWRIDLEKLYCVQENLELGFVGKRRIIEDTIATHKREFDNFVHECGNDENDEYIENPPVMLEILNRVHDIAENGGVLCHCGSTAVTVTVLTAGIELICTKCGDHKVIPAQSEQDLSYIMAVETIEIPPGRYSRHNQ